MATPTIPAPPSQALLSASRPKRRRSYLANTLPVDMESQEALKSLRRCVLAKGRPSIDWNPEASAPSSYPTIEKAA